MRILSLFLLCCTIYALPAQKHAVLPADNANKIRLQDWAKQNNKAFMILPYENAILVSNSSYEELNSFGFVSEVRQAEDQLVFNTNILLVRTHLEWKFDNHPIVDNVTVIPHQFIPKLYYVHCTENTDLAMARVINELKKSSFIDIVESKQVFTIQSTSNDPLYNRQWSLENNGTSIQSNGTVDADMDVDSAWTISEGNAAIKIAILDSGVDTLHEDLINNMLGGFDGFSTDSTDTKGYPTPNFSSDGHGTACAGIAAAQSDNNLGIAGVAPRCKIIPIRIFYYQDYGGSIGVQATTNTDALLSGSAYAWRVANADVMSTSAGLSPLFIGVLNINTQLVSDEINEAFFEGRNGYGVPMFFSAGNDDFNDVLWPGDLFTTIAIGASSMCDERKNPNDCSPENWGSSYGLSLDVVAPGVRISTTDMTGSNGYTNNEYTFTFNGTSAACPNAAGVGALILSYSPALHARDVKSILNITADRVGGYAYDSTGVNGTWNEEMGHGRVNAFAALKLAETFQTTVSIKNEKQLAQVSVYPNPSEGSINIHSTSNQELKISIYNAIGEKVYFTRIHQGTSALNLNLSPGLYYVHSEKDIQPFKLVIN